VAVVTVSAAEVRYSFSGLCHGLRQHYTLPSLCYGVQGIITHCRHAFCSARYLLVRQNEIAVHMVVVPCNCCDWMYVLFLSSVILRFHALAFIPCIIVVVVAVVVVVVIVIVVVVVVIIIIIIIVITNCS
jgi:hypothetical protein